MAIPAKILRIKGDIAEVNFGGKVVREINIELVEASLGDYVLVHAGYAIQVLDREEAQETLRLWDQILSI